MKRKIYIMAVVVLISTTILQGQNYVGFRGGLGGGFGRFDPAPKKNKTVYGLWSAGLAWRYYNPEDYWRGIGWGGIGLEVEYLKRGYEMEIRNAIEGLSYRRTINTVNIPLIWQPNIKFAQDRVKIFLNLGVALSININSTEYYLVNGEVVEENEYEMKLVRDNPFGYGLQGGLGINVALSNRLSAELEGRYYFTFGDILRNYNIYPDNPRRSPIDNFNLSVGLYYKFGGKKTVEKNQDAFDVKPVMREAEDNVQREVNQMSF